MWKSTGIARSSSISSLNRYLSIVRSYAQALTLIIRPWGIQKFQTYETCISLVVSRRCDNMKEARNELAWPKNEDFCNRYSTLLQAPDYLAYKKCLHTILGSEEEVDKNLQLTRKSYLSWQLRKGLGYSVIAPHPSGFLELLRNAATY